MSHSLLTVDRVTALATAGSFVAIAWQAFLTRRAVEEQGEFQIEAVKTRLEHRGPRVSAQVDSVSPECYQPSTVSGGTPQPCKPHQRFVLPADENEPLVLYADVTFRNQGQGTATLHWKWPLAIANEPWGRGRPAHSGERQYALGPNEKVTLRVAASRTVPEWAANFGHKLGAEFLDRNPTTISAEVRVVDEFDEGIEDVYAIELSGQPLEQVPGESGAWRVAERSQPERISCRAYQSARLYWASRIRHEALGARKQRKLPWR
jgi:hypothetical protein